MSYLLHIYELQAKARYMCKIYVHTKPVARFQFIKHQQNPQWTYPSQHLHRKATPQCLHIWSKGFTQLCMYACM